MSELPDMMEIAGFYRSPCALCGHPGCYTPKGTPPSEARCNVCVHQERKATMAGQKKTKTNGDAPHAPAAKSGDPHAPVERSRYQDNLPCPILEADVQARANELAKVIRERDRLKVQKRESNASYREKIAFFDERLNDLADSVELKTELRAVDCIEYLYPETGEIRIVRADTKEVVESRNASAEDLQESLYPPEGGGKKKRKGRGESHASASAE